MERNVKWNLDTILQEFRFNEKCHEAREGERERESGVVGRSSGNENNSWWKQLSWRVDNQG